MFQTTISITCLNLENSVYDEYQSNGIHYEHPKQN